MARIVPEPNHTESWPSDLKLESLGFPDQSINNDRHRPLNDNHKRDQFGDSSGHLKDKSEDAHRGLPMKHLSSPDLHRDEEKESEALSKFQTAIMSVQTQCSSIWRRNEKQFKLAFYILIGLLYHAYFIAAMIINFRESVALLVMTLFAWACAIYYLLLKPRLSPHLSKLSDQAGASWSNQLAQKKSCLRAVKLTRCLIFAALALIIPVFLAVDARDSPRRAVSFAGLIGYLLLLTIFSNNPGRINWRPVCWGIGLQFVFGLIVLRWSIGFIAFNWLAEKITEFLDYVTYGTKFVYGFLADPPNICGMNPVFAFSVMQTIVFFSSVVSILYYFGVMQAIIVRVGWLMQISLGTTAAESMNAACDVFLGMSEGPLMIAPYLPKLTNSELHAVLVSGFSCIAGSLFAIYASFGACPIHLLSHSIMAAPASLAVAKLLYPECETSTTKKMEDLVIEQPKEQNVLDAISNGAHTGAEIVVSIVANLISYLALLHFANNVLAWFASLVGVGNFNFETLLSYLFFPLAYMMGCDGSVEEVLRVSKLMGTKTFLNEFIAFVEMGNYIKEGQISPRNQLIATYALCGFSNIGSIGIMMGALGSLCPTRKRDLAGMAVRALVGGSIACFMTACVAGILLDEVGQCQTSHFRSDLARNCTVV